MPIHTAIDPARERGLLCAAAALLALLVWSGLEPYDRQTWVMEVVPVMVALPLLVLTYRRLPLTSLVYGLIFVHACILMLGGAYTYARVPLGFQLAQWLGLERNPYDRIGHLAQGFVPVMVAREILLRGEYVRGRRMLAFICIAIVLAISASYELIEWAAAMALGQGADQFLGTQGDVWDTQWDMFCALLGACAGLLMLSGLHDRQLAAVATA
jgi:putative membrane protein